MPQAEISIDVAGSGGLVDASDCQTILAETLSTLKALAKEIARTKSSAPRAGRWKISQASTQSPLHLTLATDDSADAEDAAEAVRVYIQGIRELEGDVPPSQPPPFFEKATLERVKRLVSVLKKDTVSLAFSSPEIGPVFVSQRVIVAIDELIGAKYNSLGALEGKLETLSDSKGKLTFKLLDPVTSVRITCEIAPDQLEEAKQAFPHRVVVYGRIKYNKDGVPLSIGVQQIRRLGLRSALPQPEDISPFDITDGVESAEYIRRLRDAE